MDVNPIFVANKYEALKPATTPDGGSTGGLLTQGGATFANVVAQDEATASAALQGGVDPHSLVQALTQYELAVEAAVVVRNKVVEAYQEILRMPV